MKNLTNLNRCHLKLVPVFFVVFMIVGCTAVKKAPQTDTAYVPASYEGQVPEATLQELEKRYPPEFWKEKPLNIPPEKRINIGIRGFLTLTQPPELGQMVTEIFTTTFAKSGAFNLIERQQLEKVLHEFELNQSGAIDPASAKKIGKISGLDVIVAGSISQIGTEQRIDARAIDISTGQIVLAEALTPVFNSQATNLRPVDYQNIRILAGKMVNQLIDRYYK